MHFEAPSAVAATAKGPRRFGVVDGTKGAVRPVGGR
jgi:hypothetical protein